ncbi:MAG: glycine cleavage system protein R [Candidatus Obscuribacterales bacterium]
MGNQLLVTAVGEDRPGIVARVTEVLAGHGANLEASRMAILGGEFAAIMLVTGASDKLEAIKKDLSVLEKDGITISTKLTKPVSPEIYKDHVRCELSLRGADHEGIVHSVSSQLRDKKINIQSVETDVVGAPITGTPLFCMNATILVPPDLPVGKLKEELDEIARSQSVDIDLSTGADKEVARV